VHVDVPPLPCTLADRDDGTTHSFARCHSETTRVVTEPVSHRRHRPDPYTQRTTPPQSTAHVAQPFPTRCTLHRVYPNGINLDSPSLAIHWCSFSPPRLSLAAEPYLHRAKPSLLQLSQGCRRSGLTFPSLSALRSSPSRGLAHPPSVSLAGSTDPRHRQQRQELV
jgi:hypothetical protein